MRKKVTFSNKITIYRFNSNTPVKYAFKNIKKFPIKKYTFLKFKNLLLGILIIICLFIILFKLKSS